MNRPTRTHDEFRSTIMMSNMSLKEERTVCPAPASLLLALLLFDFDESAGEGDDADMVSSADLRCFIKERSEVGDEENKSTTRRSIGFLFVC